MFTAYEAVTNGLDGISASQASTQGLYRKEEMDVNTTMQYNSLKIDTNIIVRRR